MNLELLGRVAPVELVVSPSILAPMAAFLRSSKVSTPGLLLPPRSPALDELRLLAAGCRACSTKDYVDNVLHARGTKNVDVRAAGVTVRFELEPAPEEAGTAAADEVVRPFKAEGFGANGGGDRGVGTGGKSAAPAKAGLGSASEEKSTETDCFVLSVGCCIYQKGKYLLGHAEGDKSTAALRHPPVSSRPPSLFQSPPLSPRPLPRVRENVTRDAEEESRGVDRKLANGAPLDTRSPVPSDADKPPLTKTPSSKPTAEKSPPMRGTRGTRGTEKVRGPAMSDYWGGGPGPKPCEEAVAIIKSLRVPLSDPHYFRVADTSLCLGSMSAKEKGGVFVRRTQVLGGREEADDGWAGELLITRCAVVGNPRQPRTRADAMLSRIRVEVSQEAVVAAARLAWSLERALAPPPPLSLERIRHLAVETGDDNLPSIMSPRVLSPPWGGSVDNGIARSNSGGNDQGTTGTSASSAESSTTSGAGVANNWSKEVPLPRLALLSGRTSLRLNVAMAGVQVRVSSRGLLGVSSDGVAGGGRPGSGTEPGPTRGTVSGPKRSGESGRGKKTRRCIRRIARQLVERIHPASASAGYRQACRLFRDEMGALGYDQSALTIVIKALVDTTARARDPEGQDGSGDGKEGFLHSPSPSPSPSPLSSAAGQQEAATPETPADATLPGELDETRELVDAGMAVLPKLPASLDGGSRGTGGGEAGEEQLMLDIASVEASGLSLALTRLTYDTRFTTTAETIVVRDSDGIRILSAGGLGSSDEGEGKRGKDSGVGVGASGGEKTAGTTNKGISSSLKASTRRHRHLRRGPERDTSSAKEKIEAAAATMAEKQKRETSALFISFIECDKKHIFGSGGDTPNVLAAAGRLATAAARGSAPPPEPGLLGSLRRDRERRVSVAIDRLSFVASPHGFLTAARAATALESAVTEAAASRLSPGVGRGDTRPADGKGSPPMCCAVVRKARPPLAPLLLRPSVSTSLQVQIGEFRSLLSLESRPLASLSMSSLSFEASRSEWWDVSNVNDDAFQAGGYSHSHSPRQRQRRGQRQAAAAGTGTARERSMPLAGWPGWTWTGGRRRADLGFLRVCLQGLGVLDLTTDGQLHTEVVSHARARGSVDAGVGATSAPPRRSSSSRKVKASVCGLRVCFLRRFMAEVIKYFGPDGLGPVFDVVRRIGCDGLDGDAGDGVGADGGEVKDQEEKNIDVVVGVEDTDIPDTWSVASSVDRRRSGSRRDWAKTAAASPVKQTRSAATPAVQSRSESKGPGAEAGMRVTAVLQDLTVVVPRNTHSREAVAVKCEELVIEVREKRGTWRLPSDVTTVESRRLERENRGHHHRRRPGAEAAPLSPHGGAVGVGDDRRDTTTAGAASVTSSSPSRLARKLGLRAPPPIDIPPSSPRMSQVRLTGKDEDGEEKQQRAAREVEERQDQADLSSDNALLPMLARRGSVASTRQSYMSTMSAHSYRSMEESGGGLGSPSGSAGSGRDRASESNSDSDEFFDAVALDTDTDGGAIYTLFHTQPTKGYRYPSPEARSPLRRTEAAHPSSGVAPAPRNSQAFAEDFRAPRIPRAWAVDDDEDCTGAEETKETKAAAGENGGGGGARRGDGERGGGVGVAGAASSEMPSSTKPTTPEDEFEGRNAVVKRIALHLKGARMLVALAPRLDTPTATATAAAVAAAAATLKAKEAKTRQAAAAAAAGGAAPPDIGAGGARIDDFLNEEQLRDQSPDAEVLPRSWQVVTGAPVYLLRSRGACGGGRGSVWDVDSLHLGRDESSPSAHRQYSGSAHSRRDAHGGWGDETSHGERGRWRGSDLGGERGGHDAHGAAAGFGTGAGAASGEAGAWSFERGHEVIRWREITKQPFDLMLFVDNGPDLGSTRILLTMPEYGSEEQDKARREGRRPGGLYICPTMAEYYLVLSLYFADNYCELDCFYGPPKLEELDPTSPVEEDWPAYGTPEMVGRVVARAENWNFSMSIPVLEASLAMDTRYFPERPASMWMAQNPRRSTGSEPTMEDYWEDPEDCVPFACFRLVNPVLCITGGMGVLRLSVAAGDIAVMDTRQPPRTLYPVILHAGPISPLAQNGSTTSTSDTNRAAREGRSAGVKEGAGHHHLSPSPQFVDATPATCAQAYVDEAFGYFRPGGEVGRPLPLPIQVIRASHKK
ncbi:unnamed protein product [Laminaria digitata]